MEIVYLHRTQGKGVEGVHIRELVKALQFLGHNVEVLSPPGISIADQNNQNSLSKSERIWNCLAKNIPQYGYELMEIIYNYRAVTCLNQKTTKRNYELIYERYSWNNWAGLKTAKIHRIPFFLEVNYTSKTPIYRKRTKLFERYVKRIDKLLFEGADGIIVVSSFLKRHLIKDFGINEDKIVILPNAADPNVFDPKIKGNEIREEFKINSQSVIGFVGGFFPWHGLGLLMKSFYDLSKKINGMLMLVGDGPMRRTIENEAQQFGLENKVIWTGEVSHSRLPKYIKMFDVAVMPHSNEWGSPMKIFEYMSMGKPVVAPNYVPLRDVIIHGEEGFLFEPKNSSELKKYLQILLWNEDLRREMGKKGREKIMTEHNWIKNAERILGLYDLIRKQNR